MVLQFFDRLGLNKISSLGRAVEFLSDFRDLGGFGTGSRKFLEET